MQIQSSAGPALSVAMRAVTQLVHFQEKPVFFNGDCRVQTQEVCVFFSQDAFGPFDPGLVSGSCPCQSGQATAQRGIMGKTRTGSVSSTYNLIIVIITKKTPN